MHQARVEARMSHAPNLRKRGSSMANGVDMSLMHSKNCPQLSMPSSCSVVADGVAEMKQSLLQGQDKSATVQGTRVAATTTQQQPGSLLASLLANPGRIFLLAWASTKREKLKPSTLSKCVANIIYHPCHFATRWQNYRHLCSQVHACLTCFARSCLELVAPGAGLAQATAKAVPAAGTTCSMPHAP